MNLVVVELDYPAYTYPIILIRAVQVGPSRAVKAA